MDFQTVPDLVQMNALQSAALLLLHAMMLASVVSLALLGLLCLLELQPGSPGPDAGTLKSQQRAPLCPADMGSRAALEPGSCDVWPVIELPGAAREEAAPPLITVPL